MWKSHSPLLRTFAITCPCASDGKCQCLIPTKLSSAFELLSQFTYCTYLVQSCTTTIIRPQLLIISFSLSAHSQKNTSEFLWPQCIHRYYNEKGTIWPCFQAFLPVNDASYNPMMCYLEMTWQNCMEGMIYSGKIDYTWGWPTLAVHLHFDTCQDPALAYCMQNDFSVWIIMFRCMTADMLMSTGQIQLWRNWPPSTPPELHWWQIPSHRESCMCTSNEHISIHDNTLKSPTLHVRHQSLGIYGI